MQPLRVSKRMQTKKLLVRKDQKARTEVLMRTDICPDLTKMMDSPDSIECEILYTPLMKL